MAMFTVKELGTGFPTEADMLSALAEYQPERILLGRFRLDRIKGFLMGDANRCRKAMRGIHMCVRGDVKAQKP